MIFFLDTDDDVNMKVISSTNWRVIKSQEDDTYLLIINGVLEYVLNKRLRDKLIASLRGATNVKHVYISSKKLTLSVDNGL